MDRLSVLIAAAGRGTRAGLAYPKTLYPVQGKPILIRIMELLEPYDTSPAVVASPDGRILIEECVAAYGRHAYLIEQETPRGMGDAVLKFNESPSFALTDHVLLVWGDIPLMQLETVSAVVTAHLSAGNDMTFATRHVDEAYTLVVRGAAGQVLDLVETRESGTHEPRPGERDIGLFVFRRDVVLEALREDAAERYGRVTGEHGFLYVVGHLVRKGYKVEAVPCATALDLVSLNSLADLNGHV